jgi:hypothetical protein
MTDEVIALLNEKFIPFAPGWSELEKTADNPQGRREAYPWFKAMGGETKKTPNGVTLAEAEVPGTPWWVATSAGQRVGARAACQAPTRLDAKITPNLKVFLTAYAKMPEAERRPAGPIKDANRPKAAPPPGGLCLSVYDKPLMRKREGSYSPLTGGDGPKDFLKKHVPWQPGAQLDALWLTKDECESLMPKNPKEGQTFPVSPHLVKRIGLFGLTVRSASQESFFWQHPDNLQKGELKLTVESVSPAAVEMRLHGSILLDAKAYQMDGHINKDDLENLQNRYDARLEGKLVYDPAKKRFTRWDVVAVGDYTGACCACEFGKMKEEGHLVAKEPLVIATSFEIDNWNYEVPPEHRRTVPYLLWYFHNRPGYDYYFDPEKWEAALKKSKPK